MNQFGHCGRAHKERQFIICTQNPSRWIDGADISQHARPKPDPIETGLVRVAREQVCRSTRVEGPGFLVGGFGCDDLEVVRVDQGFQGGFFVIRPDRWILRRDRPEPFGVNGRLIERALELVRVQVGGEHTGRMHFRVRGGSIVARILEDD